MNLLATLFQGQNLYIMIGLGVLVLTVCFLLAKRMVSRMTPEDEVYYERRFREQQKFALARLILIGLFVAAVYIYMTWFRR